MKLTRQHFTFIAEAIRTAPLSEADRDRLAQHFAWELTRTNPNFKSGRFLAAATREEGEWHD